MTHTRDTPTDLYAKVTWSYNFPDLPDVGSFTITPRNWSTLTGFVGGGPSPYWTWSESTSWVIWSDSFYTTNLFKFDGGKTIYGFTAVGEAPDPPDGPPLDLAKLLGGTLSVSVELYSGNPAAGGIKFDEFASGIVTVVNNVEIDIKPGSYPNSINLKSRGVVPVAVLTTSTFDASTVDLATVFFAGASPVRWTMEDVSSDGKPDLLLFFNTQDLNLTNSSTTATLTGNTNSGIPIIGIDTVNIVPK